MIWLKTGKMALHLNYFKIRLNVYWSYTFTFIINKYILKDKMSHDMHAYSEYNKLLEAIYINFLFCFE